MESALYSVAEVLMTLGGDDVGTSAAYFFPERCNPHRQVTPQPDRRSHHRSPVAAPDRVLFALEPHPCFRPAKAPE